MSSTYQPNMLIVCDSPVGRHALAALHAVDHKIITADYTRTVLIRKRPQPRQVRSFGRALQPRPVKHPVLSKAWKVFVAVWTWRGGL